MKLLICLVTYERLEYTKKTLRSLWSTLSDDANYFIVVADNNSTDGTQEYLKELQRRGRVNMAILNPENYYPGKACNIAWEKALELYDATHLMRLDNDMQLVKGWDKKVEAYFKAIPELGQLGYEHEAIETPQADLYRRRINGCTINEWPGCVGGPMVMRRKIWDSGIRYDESRWSDNGNPKIPVPQEDSKLSYAIKQRGWLVGHTQEELGRTFANQDNWSDYPEYYRQTMLERGYVDNIKKLEAL